MTFTHTTLSPPNVTHALCKGGKNTLYSVIYRTGCRTGRGPRIFSPQGTFTESIKYFYGQPLTLTIQVFNCPDYVVKLS